MYIEAYIPKNKNILPMQTVPFKIWLEDMMFANLIPNPGFWTVSVESVQILTRENL